MVSTFDQRRYGKPERLERHEHADWLAETQRVADVAGITLAGVEDTLGRLGAVREIQEAFRTRREGRQDAIKRIARQLVTGELDLDAAARESAIAEASEPRSILSAAIARTEDVAIARAFSAFSDGLDGEAVFSEARERAAAVRSDVVELRKTLTGVRDAEQASSAGSKVAAAWSRYRTELLPQFDAAHELVGRLRALHIIAPLPREAARAGKFGRFDRVERDTKQGKRADQPVLTLLDPLCDDWAPTGPHTEQEALKFLEEVQEAAETQDERDREIERRFGVEREEAVSTGGRTAF